MQRVIIALLLAPSFVAAETPVEFNRDIRPILSDACFNCHGFDAKARKARLRLDVPDGAFEVRRGAAAIKPGDLNGSELWTRINSPEATELMPPPHTNKKLSAEQKDLIRRWIEQGAKYQKHWSFEPVRRPELPRIQARTPIDAFLAVRHKEAELSVQPEAERETLIRRVAFALTGLPPSLKDIDDYLRDSQPGAYERMVDRYLASPHYGEEMARHWLDVARYADTHGLHLDNERAMWLYRDWVVQAFNENLPFDKFTIWQLAGDLLPNATPPQLAATGFNRCNVTTGEGGSIETEWVYRNAVDRTNAMAQAWLGLTAGCANCHDHKFDPISMKEYYSLYAFFLSAAGPALDGNVTTTAPFEKLPSPEQQATLEAAIKAENHARKLLEKAAFELASAPANSKTRQTEIEVLLDDTTPFGASNKNTTRNAPDWVADPEFRAKLGRRVLRQINSFFHEDTFTFQLRPVTVPANGMIEAWIYLDPGAPSSAVALKAGANRVWWGVEPPAKGDYGGGSKGTHKGSLPVPGVWTKLSVPASELGLKEGQRLTALTLQEHGGIVYWDAVALVGDYPSTDLEAEFQSWWQGLKGQTPPELPAELKSIAGNGPAGKHGPETVAKMRGFFLAHVAPPANDVISERREAWEKTRTARAAAETAIPGTLIFRDLDTPREAFVMMRGQYDKPGDKVSPGVPEALPPLRALKTGARPTRLDLANWLVSKENPLVARVAVNRLWQQFFGTGLVKTSADFGSQGEPPSHPELLDWLAAEYQDGWDTRKLVRDIVTSDAFRRSSKQTAELRTRDPENRLLARGPRFRLDAEQVRDNVLFVSGLIDLKMGGRGVKPYQPANIWEPIGYGDSNTRYYLQDRGSAVHRRSLYVFIKRTAPHPFLSNFDGPNREQVCSVRDRTNTPLQALQLMNDTQHFEAARALAERTLAEAGPTSEDRIAYLYRLVLARRPDSTTTGLIAAALERQRALYRADPAAARQVITVGESQPRGIAPDDETAAWTMIANLVLNLDETVNRN